MEFIREKIKKKPISKKKFFLKIGTAALCGLVFSVVVLLMMLVCMPLLKDWMQMENKDTEHTTESVVQTEETESFEDVEETEDDLVIPTDFNLSISDYQTLQDELYEIGNQANKSIVTVSALSEENADNPFETYAQGFGLIVSEDINYIYVLTEKRVISDAGKIRVTFINGTDVEASLLKSDANTGLSILTIEKRHLSTKTKEQISTAVMGSSYEVTNGSIVIALGSPLGINYSILTGNITSIQNEIAVPDKNYSVFTTDIVAGENAGGVLVNTKGEVIGIVLSSFHTLSETSTLTAIEADELTKLLEMLCTNKEVPYVGLYVSTVTKSISKEYDIPVGIYIKEVVSDSPAMKAGLQSGDVIIEIDGKAISNDKSYSDAICLLIPETSCEMKVKRQNGDEYYDVTCTVEVGVLE